MNIEQIAQKFKCYSKIEVFFNENLSARTSFKIGGPAALLVEPADTDSLCFAMNTIRQENIPFFVLGGGTNVVFADEGFGGIVVSMRKLAGIRLINNSQLTINNSVENQSAGNNQQPIVNYSLLITRQSRERRVNNFISEPTAKQLINCAAGTTMNSLVKFACDNSATGLEEFAGLPGTVGGAVYMNARCFEKEISDVAQKITWIEYNGAEYVQKEKIFAKSEWGYKKSPFTDSAGDKIIIAVEFAVNQLTINNSQLTIKEKCQSFVNARKEKGHFEYPCAGSVFKNNRAFGEPSGKIIDALGLKGRQIGGAQIAPFHGNIIINTGGATCRDVRALVELIKKESKERRGFDLEEEIIFAE